MDYLAFPKANLIPASMYAMPRDVDRDKVDQAVLALMSLGRQVGFRTWKAFDWEVMGRLRRKGCISDPVGRSRSSSRRKDLRNRSVCLTPCSAGSAAAAPVVACALLRRLEFLP